MFGKDSKLTDSVVALVAPGEQVLAAVAVQPKGQGNAMAVGGAAGALMGGKSKANREASVPISVRTAALTGAPAAASRAFTRAAAGVRGSSRSVRAPGVPTTPATRSSSARRASAAAPSPAMARRADA